MLNDDWNIAFGGARCPVTFWHGEADALVPPDIIRSFAREFSLGRVNVLEAETHLLIFRYLAQIVRALHQASPRAVARRSRTRPLPTS